MQKKKKIKTCKNVTYPKKEPRGHLVHKILHSWKVYIPDNVIPKNMISKIMKLSYLVHYKYF